MTSTKTFRRADGLATVYALACGHIDQFETDDGVRLTRWSEADSYHVRVHDFGTDVEWTVSPPKRLPTGRAGEGRILWESFDNPTDSVKMYKRLRTRLKRGGDVIPFLKSIANHCAAQAQGE